MLLGGTEQSENRKLTAIGAAFLAVIVVVAGVLYLLNPFDRKPNASFTFVVDTPYIGQGVVTGTTLVLHGLEVGEVTDVESLSGGGVRLTARVIAGRVVGLTDSFEIDFRPANYFGVTAVNLRPGAGGEPLRDGTIMTKRPEGNYTMQALLSRLGGVSGGVLTHKLIETVDKATQYTDGLTPLIETLLNAANAVAKVQTVPTEVLMAHAAGVSAGFPPFIKAVLDATTSTLDTETSTTSEDDYRDAFLPTLDVASTSLFGAVGNLLESHAKELTSATALIAVIADVVPVLVNGANFGARAEELRVRLERAFTTADGEPGIDLRIVLDQFPALAAPLQLAGIVPGAGTR